MVSHCFPFFLKFQNSFRLAETCKTVQKGLNPPRTQFHLGKWSGLFCSTRMQLRFRCCGFVVMSVLVSFSLEQLLSFALSLMTFTFLKIVSPFWEEHLSIWVCLIFPRMEGSGFSVLCRNIREVILHSNCSLLAQGCSLLNLPEWC